MTRRRLLVLVAAVGCDGAFDLATVPLPDALGGRHRLQFFAAAVIPISLDNDVAITVGGGNATHTPPTTIAYEQLGTCR